MKPFKQVYGNRTGWTFPPEHPYNDGRDIPFDAVEGLNPGDLTVIRQDGSSRYVVINQ